MPMPSGLVDMLLMWFTCCGLRCGASTWHPGHALSPTHRTHITTTAFQCTQDFDCGSSGGMDQGMPICSQDHTGACCSCEYYKGYNFSNGSCACNGHQKCMISGPLILSNAKECFQKCAHTIDCHAIEGHWNSHVAHNASFICMLFKAGATGDGNITSRRMCYHRSLPQAECSAHVACEDLELPFCCPTTSGEMQDCCNFSAPQAIGTRLIVTALAGVTGGFIAFLMLLRERRCQVVTITEPARELTDGEWDYRQQKFGVVGIGCFPSVGHFLRRFGRSSYDNIREKTNEAYDDGYDDSLKKLTPYGWMSTVSAPAVKWLTVGFALLWSVNALIPLWVSKLSTCPTLTHDANGYLTHEYVHATPTVYLIFFLAILINAVIESKALTFTLPMTFHAAAGKWSMFAELIDFKKFHFRLWRIAMAVLSFSSQLSVCLNSTFVGKTLLMDACPHKAYFDRMWRKKQKNSMLGIAFSFVGVELSFADEAYFLWILGLFQLIYAGLYAWPRDGWRNAEESAQNAEESASRFRTFMRHDQDMSGVVSVMADVSYMYSMNFADHIIASQVADHVNYKDNDTETYRLLNRQLPRGVFQILLSGVMQNAFMLHLQIALMALTYSTLGQYWSRWTFFTILLNMVKLSFKMYTEGRRCKLCFKILIHRRDAGQESKKHWLVFVMYACSILLYVFSLIYVLLKIWGLTTCKSGFLESLRCVDL